MCFVCGVQNPVGLLQTFYEDHESDPKQVCAEVMIPDRFQGYPGVAHGGVLAAILDELAGRAVLIDGGLTNGVTYWYKLEDVAFDGTRTMHGPISAMPQAEEPAEVKALPKEFGLSIPKRIKGKEQGWHHRERYRPGLQRQDSQMWN